MGDHIEIYYASNDPANVSDVRFGSPGNYDFFMSAVFGGLLITVPLIVGIVRIVKQRKDARRKAKEERIRLMFGLGHSD